MASPGSGKSITITCFATRVMRELLSKATFVPLPGTPVSSEDRDTRAVFGVYIHVNGMQQVKEDGATVKFYYE